MDCNDASKLLQACADGELGAVDGVRLERHLEDCVNCVESLRQLQALHAAVRHNAPYHRAGPALRARVLAALAEATTDDRERAGTAETVDIAGAAGHANRGAASHANPAFPARASHGTDGRPGLPADADAGAAAPPSAGQGGWRRWFEWSPALNAAMAAVTVAAVGLGLLQYTQRESPGELAAQAIVASHVRALLSEHPIDVASSDRHTVKPWFNGRIDYAPEVRDLAAQGFPLVGGRLDYVNGRRVAVLVYRRGQHPLDVFVLPDNPAGGGGEQVRQGYQLADWTTRGMRYWAVTDASAEDLRAFERAWRTAAGN